MKTPNSMHEQNTIEIKTYKTNSTEVTLDAK